MNKLNGRFPTTPEFVVLVDEDVRTNFVAVENVDSQTGAKKSAFYPTSGQK